MGDPWFLYLFLTLFTKELKFEGSTNMEIREKFEEIISAKLVDQNTSAADIKLLAEAYSELTKNDHLRDMASALSRSPGFPPPPKEEQK